MNRSRLSWGFLTRLPVLFVLIAILAAGSPHLTAGSVSGQVELMSGYIWRGWDLNPTHQPVLQPSVTYSFGDTGFAADLWFSIHSVDRETNETNVTLSYDFKLSENIALSAGFIHYGYYFADGFRFNRDTSHEVYFSASLPKLPFSPGVSVYYDFDKGDGVYVRGTVGHSVTLGSGVTADLSAALGYNGGQWLGDHVDPAFSDVAFGIELPFKVGSVSLIPSLNYSIVLMDEISEVNHFWAGLSVAF